jgi:type II secretory ATPase GspE/PulE/Tfp pilus assembly ATPase PilB-like protein
VTADDIRSAAVKSGMRTMYQDAVLKAIAGQTTIDEVYRVLG